MRYATLVLEHSLPQHGKITLPDLPLDEAEHIYAILAYILRGKKVTLTLLVEDLGQAGKQELRRL